MIKSIVVAVEDDKIFFTGHPIYTGPYNMMGYEKLKVGDKVYYSGSTKQWVKDHIITVNTND